MAHRFFCLYLQHTNPEYAQQKEKWGWPLLLHKQLPEQRKRARSYCSESHVALQESCKTKQTRIISPISIISALYAIFIKYCIYNFILNRIIFLKKGLLNESGPFVFFVVSGIWAVCYASLQSGLRVMDPSFHRIA